ncbi:MAG: carbamoyl-phosphate synthase (glutamine-hydrolyzing) large subunit [Nitrososphaeraceae archaeon]|nr:carbamoyl-phosphate synthase (glutamine-hydrolyzing) large subunit [Nitrososphaeraceae archaeon]
MKTVLVNPNIATIQTDTRFANKVYLLPVNVYYIQQIIEKELPDSIMLGFGGQTALNCGVSLHDDGILDKYKIRVLGTPVNSIKTTEDREQFKTAMIKSNVPVLESAPAYNLEEALGVAGKIGYPVIIRVAYTLGGKGGGVAHNEYELQEIVQRGLSLSLVNQVLIEKYIGSWKQIEYEMMRDSTGNSIAICNMENVLGMRVHTGDNIVIAPSQTINNEEYHRLRSAAIRAVEYCGIIGECNIQFGLDPLSESYCAIEINARLSRSSALASKATGYPLAYMAAKMALGYSLTELVNSITKATTACFEPSLDYVVLKMPRWDFRKFELVNRRIGTSMKSVGEVMAIGRTFEEVLQKAIRMNDGGKMGLVGNEENSKEELELVEQKLLYPSDEILFDVVKAMRLGIPVTRISKLSTIDSWFLEKIKNIVELYDKLYQVDVSEISENLLRDAKKYGFSDLQIGKCLGLKELSARKLRQKFGINPVVKQIDTLAAEWPAKTNYLYLTYGGAKDDIVFRKEKNSVIVLGAGPYRIGSSVEFDWGTVNMVWGLKNNGIKSVSVINCNPETVSTDYDISDRLYFEELSLERILDIYEKERPKGIVTCVGGQTANNLVPKLGQLNVNIIGTDSVHTDMAEDREKFSKLLDSLNIKQPPWNKFTDLSRAKIFSQKVGFPVLVRPSYVLSGAAMKVIWNEEQLDRYINEAAQISPEYPIVISKFFQDSAEVEVDAVCNGKDVIIGALIEHIDNAGIHSGDAMMCIPPWRLNRQTMNTIVDYSNVIAKKLEVKGPLNIQYLVKDDEVYVIEANVRASRTTPFVSKIVGINLISLASKAILNGKLPEDLNEPWLKISGFGIKVPQFSFMQLEGSDIVLGVEMQSTGEVACHGNSFYDALSKAYEAAGYNLPLSGSALITIGGQKNKEKMLSAISLINSMKFNLLATEHTAEFIKSRITNSVQEVHKISEPIRKPNIADLLYNKKIDFIINIPSTSTIEKYVGMLDDEYQIRRKAVEMGIPVLTTVESAISFIHCLEWRTKNKPSISPLSKYRIN